MSAAAIWCWLLVFVAQTPPPQAAWPPLPHDFRGDFTLDMATMKKLAGVLTIDDGRRLRLFDVAGGRVRLASE